MSPPIPRAMWWLLLATALGAGMIAVVRTMYVNGDTTAAHMRATAVEHSLSTPAAMYGKLLDQHGNPIAGATVKYSFRGGMLRIVKGSGRGSTVTDDDGRFVVRGRGAAGGLGVVATNLAPVWIQDPKSKEWRKGLFMEPTSNNGRIGWKNHGPDNPFVIRAYRTEMFPGKEMRRGRGVVELPPNGRVFSMKIRPHKRGGTRLLGEAGIEPDALFSVSCEREPYDRTKRMVEQESDWRYVFRASDGGGVQLGTLPGPTVGEAPADGYKEHVEVRRVIDPNHSERRFRAKQIVVYFMANRGRTYGAVIGKFLPFDRKDHCELSMSYRLRTDGGRNLAVRSINRLPVSEPPDTIHTQVNTPVEFTITAHDPDVEQELTVDPYGFTRGRVDPRELKVVDGKATFVFKPRKDYEGPASFLYSVTDGNGGRLGPITVHVQVGELAEGEAEPARLERADRGHVTTDPTTHYVVITGNGAGCWNDCGRKNNVREWRYDSSPCAGMMVGQVT